MQSETSSKTITIKEITKDELVTLKLRPSLGQINGSSGNKVPYRNSWELDISLCTHCLEYTIWENKIIIYPFQLELPQPHEDMCDDIKGIYVEAMHVYKYSPRASAALLRLSIETMIPQLDEYKIKKDTINNKIAELVKMDIPQHVQQGLDSIRIYGNEGIHAGEIFLNEEPETVLFLFELLNIMVEELITKKKKEFP